MENKLRRGLALLMTLIMLISCAPMDALAAIVPVSGGTQNSEGLSLLSIVKPPVATHTYIFMNDFMNGDNKEFARQIVKNGETLNNPGTPDAGSPNKEFTGWRDGAGNAPVFGAVTVTDTKTITYHAQFADVYFVFFTNEKGEVMVTKKGANGEAISTEGVTYPVGNEESIVGWEDANGSPVSSVTLNGSDVTLKAKVEKGHWITFDSQGGTYVAPAFVKGNGTTTAPAAPTRPGYTFRHWSATVGGAAFTFGNALTTALTLYAVWTPNTRTQYTVIHWQENADDDEYSYAVSETKYGTTGAQTSAEAKTYEGFTAQTIAQQTIAGDGSTIVNVYYKRDEYSVKFFERKNSRWQEITSLTITAKYGANISKQWPTYKGSSMWSTTGEYWLGSLQGPYQVNIETMPLNGAKFYGPKTGSGSESAYYYVEVLPGESGETVSGVTYKLHHKDTSPGTGYTVTVEDQYPITGFTFNSYPSTETGDRYNNAKFYYTRNSYNIVYVSGGQTVNTASKKFEESIADAGSYTPDTKPVSMESYEFRGWYSDPAGEKPYNFTGETMPAQNVTVYAKWVKPVFNAKIHLTITIDGQTQVVISDIQYGDPINSADLLSWQKKIMGELNKDSDQYEWHGWRYMDGTPFNENTRIYKDVELKPYYTKKGTFKVEYNAVKDGVTAPKDGKSYAEDSFADLMSPGKLVADGEYFLGWYDGTATYQPRDKYQIKSNHANEQNVIILTAQWGARPAGTTLTYKANGGAGEDVVENLANNATVTTRPGTTFSRVGYTFKGWDTDPKGTGSIKAGDSVQVDNNGANVLYAIWTANTDTKYTVEFYYQNVGGTYTLNHSDERTATTDTEVSATDADKAAKENNKYVFEADNKNNVLSGNVAGDGSLVLKLYFKLNTASYTIHHYLNGTTVKVADDQTGAMTIGEELTANKSNALYLAYAAAEVAGYQPQPPITIVADESKNVITVYYAVPLTIKAKDASKTYDGDPLTQPDFTMKGLVNGDTKDSFSLSMTADSTITNAGSTPNVIDTDTVKYKGGAIPSYYNVSYKPGTLTVKKASATVTITGVKETAVYDGKEHEANGYNYSFTGKQNEITISLKPNVLAIARRTDVGTTYMGLTKDSFTVTSANYDVTINAVIDGYVTITPVTDKVTVTVTENGAIVTYDGNEHSVKGYKSMTADNALYDVNKSVKATETAAWTAKGTNAGEYPVGVAAGDFENINENFTNVAFKIVDGVLKINPITENTITITANSASKTYDGTPLTNNGFTFTEGVLVKGDELTAVVEGSATNVGDEGKNVVKNYKVMRDGVDVTGNYTFTDSVDGKLTNNKRTVNLTSETASKEYDGKPLTKPVVTVTGNGFVTGEVSDIKATGSATFVDDGKVTNAITYTEGENFKETNYTISKEEGKLSITKRGGEGKTITVTANSDEKVYDGAPPTNNGFTHAGALVEGDELTAVVEGSQTDVGSSNNVVTSYKVMRGETDVTNNYTFGEPIIGTLTVTPVAIELTAASASKQYDGTPLTKNDYEISNGAFVGEEGLASVTVVGSQTLVGESANKITAHSLKGNTLAQNYTITYQPGKLTVTKNEKAITVTANSHTWEYDGQPHSDGGYTVEYDGQTYKVEAGKTVTLQTGDIVKAKITKTVTNVSDSAPNNNTIDELTIVNAAGEDTKGQYKTVTLIPGTLTITKRGAGEEKVKITAADNTVEYDGQPHGAKLNAANQIEVGTSFTVTNLADGHSVKTLAIDGSETDAGVYANKLVPGNAVIVDGNGVEVTANYDITYVSGTLTITQRGSGDMKVVLTAANNTVVYDGQPHGVKLNDKGEIEAGVSYTITNLADGHKVQTVAIDGTETAVGEYEDRLVPSGAKIVDAAGNDVTRNYVVGYEKGKLTITSPDTVIVTISGNKDRVEYDGQKHEVNGYVVKSISNALYTDADFGFAEGAAAHAEGTDAGEYPMNLTKDSFVNKNTNFSAVTFVVTDGGLTITKRGAGEEKVKITAADNTVYYDGQPHGAKLNAAGQIEVNVSYTTEYLAPGHKVQSVVIDGSRTKVGLYKDELVPKSAVIVDKTDKDVTENYEITYVPGTLEIRKNETEIKVTANSHTWEYDGQAHSDGGYTVTYGNESYTVKAGESATLSTGDKVTAVVKGQVKDVDDTKAGNNEIVEWSVEHRDFYNNVTPANGTLTITPRKVTLTSASDSKPYDGTPLTNPEVAVTGDGFVAGEVSDIKATGSVTYVSQGEVDNLITFTKKEGFKDSNYEIEERIGKLSIEALDVTIIITGPSAIREYKPGVTHTIVTGGSELDFVYGSDKVDGKIGVKGMVKGDKILPGTLKHTLEGMYVGEYEGVFTLFDSNGKKADKPTVMHDGVDVTENYKFSYNPGKLTITGKHMDGGKEVENEVPEKNYLLGQKIPFTITVRSVSKDELKEVTVTDPTATILPDRNTANPAYTVSEDEHTATITSLAPEAEVIVYAEHEVTEDDIINRYTNEATINWGNDEVKVSKTPSIEEENPEAELVKEIVLQDGQDENHKFKLGETVYFKITVTNTGNVTLNEYEVKEVLPGAAFIDGTGYTLNNDKTVATIEKMEPIKDGQEAPDSNQIVLYAQYTIKEEDLGNKELKNIVTADNSKPGEVPIPVDEAKSVSGQKIWKDEGNAFNTRPASITLTLMRKLGQNGAAEQYRTMQLGSNDSWRYSFDHLPKHDAQENEYFYWVVEEPVTGYDTAYETKDESHCDIVNNLQTYTLTIHYWQHKLGDTKMEQAFPDYVATLYYKQPYDVESPEREGIILDDMSQARISGTMPVHDLVIDVYYHRIAYRLTIHYIYQDGTMAHEDYTWTYWFNSTYNVPSPIIPGFTPSIDVIAGRMPSHGLELTVVYVGDGEIVIPDEDTSLGFKSYLNAGECFE